MVAYQDDVIFQRTESGSAEIRSNKVVLRHNERVVLVVIDGVNTYADLRAKLRSLVRDKFDRALDGLKEKGLIVEVLFPLIDRQKDAIDPDVLVDFLKTNSRLAPDIVIGEVAHFAESGAERGGQAFSSMISDNGHAGLSVNTKTGVTSQLGNSRLSPERSDVEAIDLPLDVSLNSAASPPRAKTKLENIDQRPVRKKRKRSRRPVIVQIGWHIYVYYGLLAVGVLLVIYSIFSRTAK